jgi:hypothetical protein
MPNDPADPAADALSRAFAVVMRAQADRAALVAELINHGIDSDRAHLAVARAYMIGWRDSFLIHEVDRPVWPTG